ncbi:hypothetical protein RF55_21410 [Lasius niger]|uniref:Uncharacterized protein n=1 Tax=Lasius niger TaxID=67767 RepID=A0A0J7MQW1_LASNI|nr:hypothetical protein RF55_21410 [Lasius niger]
MDLTPETERPIEISESEREGEDTEVPFIPAKRGRGRPTTNEECSSCVSRTNNCGKCWRKGKRDRKRHFNLWIGKRKQKKSPPPPRKPLGEEECSSAKKEKRTRKWVTGTSLLSGDGEAPTTQRTTEEVPHPPTGGETSPVREEERIEDDEMNIVREEEEFVHKEEGFPPLGPRAPGRGEPGTLHIVQGRTERIIFLGTRGKMRSEKEISFIAKLEGTVERILDKRLPIPSFRERKEAEKAAKMQQQ